MTKQKQIFLALDDLSKDEILKLVDELKDDVMFKINDSFTKYGPELISEIHKKGGEVFLDLKFHDIPNTVANYSKVCAEKNVFMFNVHCLGGFEMMKAAKDSLDKYCAEHKKRKPLLIGVTILTSMNEETLKDELNITTNLNETVKNLALLAKKAGLDGVVCSPKEVEIVKKACGKNFLTVTPGIRPSWSESGDQKRITTPKDAKKLGTEYVVVGRPIIQASKFGLTRIDAAKKIIEEMK